MYVCFLSKKIYRKSSELNTWFEHRKKRFISVNKCIASCEFHKSYILTLPIYIFLVLYIYNKNYINQYVYICSM